MNPWIGGVFGLLGVALGASISQFATWFQQIARHVGYWSAMSAEVDLCHGMAEAYERDNVAAPLYRLPVLAYEGGFPALLSDGAVKHDDAMAILRFYSQVSQINRGLDQAQELRGSDSASEAALSTEQRRLRLKASALCSQSAVDPGGPYYEAVRKCIDTNLAGCAKRREDAKTTIALLVVFAIGLTAFFGLK